MVEKIDVQVGESTLSHICSKMFEVGFQWIFSGVHGHIEII